MRYYPLSFRMNRSKQKSNFTRWKIVSSRNIKSRTVSQVRIFWSDIKHASPKESSGKIRVSGSSSESAQSAHSRESRSFLSWRNSGAVLENVCFVRRMKGFRRVISQASLQSREQKTTCSIRSFRYGIGSVRSRWPDIWSRSVIFGLSVERGVFTQRNISATLSRKCMMRTRTSDTRKCCRRVSRKQSGEMRPPNRVSSVSRSRRVLTGSMKRKSGSSENTESHGSRSAIRRLLIRSMHWINVGMEMRSRSMPLAFWKMLASRSSLTWCRISSDRIQRQIVRASRRFSAMSDFVPMSWRSIRWSWHLILRWKPSGGSENLYPMTMRHLSDSWQISSRCSPSTLGSIACIEIFRARKFSQARRSPISDKWRSSWCERWEKRRTISLPERSAQREIIPQKPSSKNIPTKRVADVSIFCSMSILPIGLFLRFSDFAFRVSISQEKNTFWVSSRKVRSSEKSTHSAISSVSER